jgi:hypothetical protein
MKLSKKAGVSSRSGRSGNTNKSTSDGAPAAFMKFMEEQGFSFVDVTPNKLVTSHDPTAKKDTGTVEHTRPKAIVNVLETWEEEFDSRFGWDMREISKNPAHKNLPLWLKDFLRKYRITAVEEKNDI